MHDWMSLLMNAEVVDSDGIFISDVTGIHIVGGKLTLTIDVEVDDDDYETDDPDGGEEITEDEEELDNTEETGNTVPLRAIVGGRG